MAIKSGRVGVRADQVDVYGRITNIHPGFYEGVSAESLAKIITGDVSVAFSKTSYGKKVINSIKGNTIVSGNELVPFNGTGIKIVGFNQWDEEIEQGGLNSTTGAVASDSVRSRSVNFIHVLPNTQYYCYNLGGSFQPYYYDAEQNYISYDTANVSNATFTTPSNCHFIKFRVRTDSIPYEEGNICVNISSSRNGVYEPYKEEIIALPVAEYFPTGMKKAVNAYDELTSIKAITRVGKITVNGSENWVKSSSYEGNYYCALLRNARINTLNIENNFTQNIVTSTSGLNSYNKCVLFDGSVTSQNINIKNTDITTLADFKAWLQANPITFYYELATSTEEDAHLDLSSYNTYDGGTEQLLSVTETSPLLADITSYTVGATGNDVEKLLGSIAQVETSPATTNHAEGDYIMYNYQLYKVTASITTGASLVVGTNITATTVMDEFKTL